MAVKLQLRYDTAANWTSNNPTLLAGEIGIESDTKKMKVGDGTTAWTSLAYAFVTSGSPAITTSLTTSSTSFDLLNTTATTLNFAGAATTLNIGATTGTATINNPTIIGSQTTQNLFNTVATTINFAGAATALTIGATTGSTTLRNSLMLPAGTTTMAPLDFASGTNLTTASAGSLEYDGSFFYATKETTSGRGTMVAENVFRLASNGSAIGTAIADFFGTTSSINLAASSVYEIEFFAYFTKTTAGTVTFTLTASSAPTQITGYYIGSGVTGINVAATPTTGYAGSAAATTAAFAATGSLTTAVNHAYRIKATVITNAATTFKLQTTESAGTVTPLAGSYYTVKRISSSQGSFA